MRSTVCLTIVSLLISLINPAFAYAVTTPETQEVLPIEQVIVVPEVTEVTSESPSFESESHVEETQEESPVESVLAEEASICSVTDSVICGNEVTPANDVTSVLPAQETRTPSGGNSVFSAAPQAPLQEAAAQTELISGIVFEDNNGNGIFENPETGLEGWTVDLFLKTNNGTTSIASEITDATGKYQFSSITPGTYIIRVQQKHELRWAQTSPVGGQYEITLVQNQQITDQNFGEFREIALEGSVWYDLNVDGIWQQTGTFPEPGLANWTVKAVNNNGQERTLTTNEQGFFVSIFRANEMGTTWNISESTQGRWQHTYPRNPAHYLETLTGSGQFLSDRNLGAVKFFEVLGMRLAPYSGDDTQTHAARILTPTALTIPMNSGVSILGVSTSSTIMRTDGRNFNINDLTMHEVDVTTLSGFAPDIIADEAVFLGIHGTEIDFNRPVVIDVFMGSAFEGQTFNILRSVSGTDNWNSDGIVTPSCTVMGGMCLFEATKTSFFAITHSTGTPPPPPPPPPGGSTGGVGGGGGGSSSGSKKFPIPPPSGNGGNPPPPSIPFPPPAPEIIVINTGVGGGEFVDTDPIAVAEEETNNNEENTKTTTEESESTSNEDDQAGFLAGLGNILTLGTGNTFLGLLVLAAIIFLILFLAARRNEKEKEAAA